MTPPPAQTPPPTPPDHPSPLTAAVAEVQAVHATIRREVKLLSWALAGVLLLVALVTLSDYRGCRAGNRRSEALRAVVEQAVAPAMANPALTPEQRRTAGALQRLTEERTRPDNCLNPLRGG